MPDPRIIVPGAIPPGSEIDRVFQEVLRGHHAKATDGMTVLWSQDSRDAARRVVERLRRDLPPDWSVERTEDVGGIVIRRGSRSISASLSPTLRLDDVDRNADDIAQTARETLGG